MSYSSDHHSTPSFYYRAQHTEQEVFANGRLALVLEMHKLSQACRKGTHPHSLIYHWNLPLYMFKRKELRHGYTHVLPTRPPLRSQAVAFHQPWPHRGGTREESPTSPGMNVLLPTEGRSHATRFWCDLKKPGAEVVIWLFSPMPLAWHGGRVGEA